MAPPTDTPPPVPPSAETPPLAVDAREQVHSSTQAALADLRDRVQKGGSDFESNEAYNRIQTSLQQFFEENNTDAPTEIQQAWRDEVIKFMTEEIKAYNWSYGTMDTDEVRQALEAVKDPNKKSPKGQTGIGGFEQWINKPDNPHKTAYEKWKAEKAAERAKEAEAAVQRKQAEANDAEVQRKAAETLAAQKQELGGIASNLEARLTVLTPAIIPAALLKEVQDLKANVANDDGTRLENYRAAAAALEPKIGPVEALKELAENPDIPEARKNEILALVREGKKDPAEAKRDLEAALQAANLPVAVDEEAPIGDRLLGWAGALPDGPMKKLALGLASFFATLCTTKWIGGWFRGKLMSNRTLAEKFGDAEATKAVKVEQEFRRFGLPENLVTDLGKKKTKEVLALLRQKPADITKDTAQQGKLAKLADNIEAKGGATNDDTLVNFMSDGNIWKDIVYPGAALAAAGVATGAASGGAAAAPSNTPASVPGQTQNAPTEPAPATTAASSGTPKPPETTSAADIEKQRIAAINESLRPYIGQPPVDLTSRRFEFELPYNANGKIERMHCAIYGNTFEIGTHKYNMELPMGASLKSIAIEGTVESGSATLIAGKFMFSDSREIPLREMLGHLEALRQGPQTHPATIGTDTATFTKIA